MKYAETISETLFQEITNRHLDAIIYYEAVRNSEGKVTDFIFRYMNDACFRILQGTRETYIGKTFSSLFPDGNNSGMLPAFIQVAETGQTYEHNFYYKDKVYDGWYRDTIVKWEDGLIVYFRDITESKKLEVALEKLLREKDIILKESHHRIKNNLQLILSILHLQQEKTTNHEAKDVITDAASRVSAISLVHNTLGETNSYEKINLSEYIRKLVASIADVSNVVKRVKYVMDIDDIICSAKIAVNIGLIINELITNSLKYAFQDRQEGLISVSIKDHPDYRIISVEDNGIGIKKEIVPEKAETLGMQIISALAEQLNGEIKISNETGTKVSIEIRKDFF